MKYTDTYIGFQEFPDEISLLINISNCPFHCPGCHSPELWEDVGEWLDGRSLYHLIESNKGVTCIGFMGGNPLDINDLAELIKIQHPELKVGWYWGGSNIPNEINTNNFDYIKIGPYIEKLGGLDNPNTNQIMYEIDHTYGHANNITSKFWK